MQEYTSTYLLFNYTFGYWANNFSYIVSCVDPNGAINVDVVVTHMIL